MRLKILADGATCNYSQDYSTLLHRYHAAEINSRSKKSQVTLIGIRQRHVRIVSVSKFCKVIPICAETRLPTPTSCQSALSCYRLGSLGRSQAWSLSLVATSLSGSCSPHRSDAATPRPAELYTYMQVLSILQETCWQ